MKLVIIIPAFNEETSLPFVLKEIPKTIPGISEIEVLVIDDGSADKTSAVAKAFGARLLRHSNNRGLAQTFRDGLESALFDLNADIIVNTDADNQYNQTQIPLLVNPILEHNADLVLGSRFAGHIEYMPWANRVGNILATKAVSIVSGLPITDGQTGFRAFSREAALRLMVLSRYTYTQETILQAAYHRFKVVEVPIDFRKRSGKSRLISSLFGYAKQSALVLLMGYLNYKPLRVFLAIGGSIFLVGLAGGLFILSHFLQSGQVTPHFPLALVSVAFLLFGSQIMALGLVAEMIKNNRKITEDLLYRQKKMQLEKNNSKSKR